MSASISWYWLHLYRTKSLMSKIGQFLTDILIFCGHLDFLSTQNSYIWIICYYSIYFEVNTNFVAQRQGDIDNIIHGRQPFWVLAAILDSGWVTTCVPGFFWSYIYCQHILIISCWYHEVKYICAISLHYMRLIDLIDKPVGDRDHLATSRHVKMLRGGLFWTDLSVSLIDFS